jgi:hypothetical protein
MIDFGFAVFDAGTKLIFIGMGLLFFGIGLMIAGHPLWQRFRWARVKARIVELRTERVQIERVDSEKPVPKAIFLFLIVPLIFMGIGGYFAFDYARLKMTGVEVPAQIVRMDSNTDSEGSTTFRPVVSYQDRVGREVIAVHGSGSSGAQKEFRIGDQVTVFYDEAKPDYFIIDRFWFNMLMPLILMGFGSVFILIVYASVFMKAKSKAHNTYLPVFEYVTPSGQMIKAQEENARYSLTNNVPGQDVYIYLHPDRQEQPSRPSYMIAMIGLIFMVPGLLILSETIKGMEFGWPLIVAFLGGVGFIAFKIMRHITPHELHTRWRSMASQFKIKKDLPGKRDTMRGTLLDLDAIYKLQRERDRQAVMWMPVYAVLMSGLLYGGCHIYNKQAQFEARALQAEAEVVRLIASSDSDGTVYYPLYRFVSVDGSTIDFKDSVGSNPPSAKQGDRVDALYEKEHPHEAIVDRGWLNRLPGAAMIFFGGWGLFASVRSFLRAYPRFTRNI